MNQALSDLCGICHAEKPKYRCPRCKAGTCSLQCYKKHQQRASCSGKRDPAAYVKKSQLATPGGIDQDYNYLKSIERVIDGVSRDVNRRGIGIQPRKSKVAMRGWHRDSVLQRYLTENRITVQHAPEGMSRNKNNDTRATKNGNIVWTIEWADGFGVLGTQDNFPASKSIGELHAEFQKRKFNAERRLLNLEKSRQDQRGSKRKRPQDESAPTADSGILQREEQPMQRLKEDESPSLAKPDELEAKAATSLGTQDDEQGYDLEVHETHLDDQSDRSSPPVEFIVDNDVIHDASDQRAESGTLQPDEPSAELKSTTGNYYYLLKPGTAGPDRVLVLLSSQSSLTDSLRDQIVREYPTIHVLPDPPDSLPVGFVLEEQYVKSTKWANHISNANVQTAKNDRSTGSTAGGADVQGDSAADKLDANNILNMLKRDMMR